MKFTAVLALLGVTEAAKLRLKSTTKEAVTTKRVGVPVNLRSAKSIMDTFDKDGNGTIWQNKEFIPAMEKMCGGNKDCVEGARKQFLDARGEKADGIQIEEVIAWIEKTRNEHIDEVMQRARDNNGNQDAEMITKQAEMNTVHAEFDQWFNDWKKSHVEWWRSMAKSIAEEICMDNECVNQSMAYFNQGLEAGEIQNGVTEEELRGFVMYCESFADQATAGPPEQKVVCIDNGKGMKWEEFKNEAHNHGGRLPTTGELEDHIKNEMEGKSFMDGDFWTATTDADGKTNYLQMGNNPWYPGMNHNSQGWGRPWESNGNCGRMCSVLCFVPPPPSPPSPPPPKQTKVECFDNGKGMTWEEMKTEADVSGGRLPTTEELQGHIMNEMEGKPFMDGDFWTATADKDGKTNYLQMGNNPWYPGMNHNEQGWGRPWETNGNCGKMCSIVCMVPN